MTDHDHPANDADLRFRLRQLPREIEPGRDLWPGIDARLQRPVPQRRPFAAWTGGLALAASVLVAVVAFQALRQPAANAPVAEIVPAPAAAKSPVGSMVKAEARAMTAEYEAALAEYAAAPIPAEAEPGLAALDRSARDIRLAIDAAPGSTHLLQMLQRTYARRIELTHRAATG